jgi:hypothetical protein
MTICHCLLGRGEEEKTAIEIPAAAKAPSSPSTPPIHSPPIYEIVPDANGTACAPPTDRELFIPLLFLTGILLARVVISPYLRLPIP